MREVLIDIKNIQKVYLDTKGNEVKALEDINLEIYKGEFISFVGASGCGKTTLLRLIAGLTNPQKGTLLVDGKKIEKPDFDRGYIFQQPTLFPWDTVEENVAVGLKARKNYEAKKHLIQRYIDMIGLTGFEKSYPHEISGGMAQRAAIIRALINEPKILLLDEPMGALDAFKRIELQDLLRMIWEKTSTTMAMVTHDVDEAIYLSDRIVIMTPRPGKISKIINVSSADLGTVRNRNDNAFINLRKEILEELHLVIAEPMPEFNL
jgi:ABC-type nitrate/sulfonate/bicarbonate transport system ATPase subunit